MKAIIVGAGLGGLTAAISFAKNGHKVVVFERKDRLWSNGGGINISAGASHLLSLLDLEDDLADISDHTAQLHQRDLKSGQIKYSFDLGAGREGLARTVLRSDLSPMLYQTAIKLGVDFRFGQGVTGVKDDQESATIVLDNGAIETAEIIIAADGVRSRLRYKILSDVVTQSSLDPIHSNRTYYLAHLERTPSDMDILVNGSPTVLNFWAGKDDKFAISLYNPTRDNLSAVFCVREAVNMDKLWDEDGDIDFVRERFSGLCHPELQQILDTAKSCERWQLSQMPVLPRWRSQNGRVILLGDASKAMHPTAGSGYSSTVEDISILSFLLKEFGEQIGEATKAWEDVCKPRSERLKGYSNHLSLMYEGDPDTLQEVGKQAQREAETRATDPTLETVQADREAGFATLEFSRWMSTYDALAEAEKYLARFH